MTDELRTKMHPPDMSVQPPEAPSQLSGASSDGPMPGLSALAWVARERSLTRLVRRTALECGLRVTIETVNRALEAATAEIDGNSRPPVRRATDAEGWTTIGQPGNRVMLNGAHSGQRVGTVLEVRGTGTDPSYLVEWSEGDRSVLYPGSATKILPPEPEQVDRSRSGRASS